MKPESNIVATTVELILATGSREGLRVTINEGYYMIGRDQECQIRPKSRSVSRHHCLLQHDLGVFRVFDLQSSSGTYVNSTRLAPHCWRVLNDGDLIRCGKIAFHVYISTGPGDAIVDDDDEEMQTDAAWQEFDIAGFLDAEDEAERAERYGTLRRNHANQNMADGSAVDFDEVAENDQLEFPGTPSAQSDAPDLKSHNPDSGDTDSGDRGSRNHAVGNLEAGNPDSSDTAVGSDDPGDEITGSEFDDGDVVNDSQPRKKATPPPRLPKAKNVKRARSLPSLSFSFRDPAQLKTLGVIVLLALGLAYLVYSIYHTFVAPVPIRVMDELL